MAHSPLHPLLIVAGPTASGKSHLALELAERFGGEIVNCDSLQIYRGLEIGTAKTPEAERRGVRHHLFDLLAPDEIYNAGQYAADARSVLREIAGRGRLPVVVGGTGFYLKALMEGLGEGPKRDEALRQRLAAREARKPGSLHRVLARLDAAAAARIHPNDVHKTLRALEIRLVAGRPAARLFEAGARPLAGFDALWIGLDPPRAALHARIGQRTRAMFDGGLLEEVRGMLEQGVPATAKAFESIGYKEALACLRGEVTRDQAVELTTIATRQYAKRQMTWFRRQAEVKMRWLGGFGDEGAIGQAAEALVEAWAGEFTKIT